LHCPTVLLGVGPVPARRAYELWVGPFHEEPDEVTHREIEVNLYGTTLGSKLALARMLPRGRGHLVNIASGVGRVALPGSATYSRSEEHSLNSSHLVISYAVFCL